MSEIVDRAVARVKYEWASALFVRFPALGRRVVGDEPVQWKLAKTPASDIRHWQVAPGCKESGPVPALYRSRMIIHADRAALDHRARHCNAQPAAAFNKPGNEQVLVTVLPFGEQGIEDQLDVILGIGQNALHSTLALYVPRDRVLISANTVLDYTVMRASLEEVKAQYPGAISV